MDCKLHQMLCSSFATLTDRPSHAHKLAIVLPEKSKEPELVWVEYPSLTSSHIDELLSGATRDGADRTFLLHNTLRKIEQENALVLFLRGSFQSDGSIASRSLLNITFGADVGH